MPIEDEFRFWAPSGRIMQGGPSDWYIADCDQRRRITVRMDEEQDESDLAIKYLKLYIDNLAPSVTMIHVAPDGKLIAVSSDPEDDNMGYLYHPPLDLVERRPGVQTVLRSELRELERLANDVDLVSYQTEAGPRKAVFKYYWQWQFIGRCWDELHLWMRLSPHPNIVPFDRIVLEEVNGGVVGFTSVYVPGGTVEDNRTRPFKLKWCRQLTELVDELNLRYGIVHQDVAPRNLLVDEAVDNVLLFDFNWSSQIGRHRGVEFFKYRPERDDVRAVVFTVYEAITRDFHFREQTPPEQLDLAMVRDIEWVPHPDVTLDHPVADYRALLDAWLEARERGPNKVAVYTDAPEYIDWPPLEEPLAGPDSTERKFWEIFPRREARAKGIPIVDWQRPAQHTLEGDYHLLATGQLLGANGEPRIGRQLDSDSDAMSGPQMDSDRDSLNGQPLDSDGDP